MAISKKLFSLLAIFCVIASAGMACAADVVDDGEFTDVLSADDNSGYSGSQYDDGGWAGSQYEDDGGWAGSQYNETLENGSHRPYIDPDYAHMEPGSNASAAGEPINNSTGNNTAAAYKLPATGNPIIALLAVTAVIGGYSILKRKD